MTSNRVLHVDLETYCEADLKETGVYAYAKHPSFQILLFAYAFDNDPVRCIDLTCEELPPGLLEDLYDESITKVAHNANFEMNCISSYFKREVDPKQWEDTMVMAYHQGLPGSLDKLSEVLGLEKAKMKVGTTLINYFSKPCKPTKANGQRTRNLPRHDPDKWELFKTYCIRDVEAEQEIYNRLSGFSQPAWEREVCLLDKEINDRGILCDVVMANNAVSIDAIIKERHENELRAITGLDNPNSGPQFKGWLGTQGYDVQSFTKKTAKEILEGVEEPKVRRAIELKLLMSKTSTAKYVAMTNSACEDNRIRGLFQYYGANRTGRWAGRLVQLQNLPQNKLEQEKYDELTFARTLVAEHDLEFLEMFYDDIPNVLSQLIRTAFVAKEGHKFIVADYSAIEARVIAWLAGEKWRMDLFANGGDIYCESASQMFKVPVVKHGVNGHLRQKGKIAELACGYGGGVGAMKSMGGADMGLSEEEMQEIVEKWRKTSPAIVKLWGVANDAALEAIDTGNVVEINKGITFKVVNGNLILTLPSKRKLVYQSVSLQKDRYGYRIKYKGMNQVTRKWEALDTYGGKLVENMVQAIARDCLATAMLRLAERGYKIVGHIHDEVIIEAPVDYDRKKVNEIMALPIDWAKGLYLPAESYETPYYKKD